MSVLFVPPPFDGVVEVDVPEQIAERAIASIDGLGLTVTDTLNGVPEQLPDLGVTA